MPDAEEEAYMTIGLIVMAAMMGAMLFMGGHKKGHKHSSSQPPAVEVSSDTDCTMTRMKLACAAATVPRAWF